MNAQDTLRLVQLLTEMTKIFDAADQHHAAKMTIAISMAASLGVDTSQLDEPIQKWFHENVEIGFRSGGVSVQLAWPDEITGDLNS